MTLQGDPLAAKIRIYNVLLVTSGSCFLCFCVGCKGCRDEEDGLQDTASMKISGNDAARGKEARGSEGCPRADGEYKGKENLS